MTLRLVGIGDYAVSNDQSDTIKTIGLGSCVAIVISDPLRHVVALAHIVLPAPPDEHSARTKPAGYFADTAVKALLKDMARYGSGPRNGPLMTRIAGGAATSEAPSTYNIGKRNILAAKKALWQHGLTPCAEDVGGTVSRTVSVTVKTQTLTVSFPDQPPKEL